jgi:hypothetical protein
MEIIVLLIIVLFLFLMVFNYKKQFFQTTLDTSNTTTKDTSTTTTMFNPTTTGISVNITKSEDKIKTFVDGIERELTKEQKKYHENNNKLRDVIYTFDVDQKNVHYSNTLEDCGSHYLLENLNKSDSLYSYTKYLIDSLLDFSNKSPPFTKLTLVNIDRLERTNIENGFNYIIDVFLLHYDIFKTNKYSFNINVFDEYIEVKSVDIVNSVEPIKQFTCDDEKHCTGSDSSLKKENTDISKLQPNYDSDLYFADSNITEETSKQIKVPEINKNLKEHITLENEPVKAVFPCNTNEHNWDINGVNLNTYDSNNCYGSDFTGTKRNPEPFYHISFFNNFNFEKKNIDTNDSFRWKNMVGRDIA